MTITKLNLKPGKKRPFLVFALRPYLPEIIQLSPCRPLGRDNGVIPRRASFLVFGEPMIEDDEIDESFKDATGILKRPRGRQNHESHSERLPGLLRGKREGYTLCSFSLRIEGGKPSTRGALRPYYD